LKYFLSLASCVLPLLYCERGLKYFFVQDNSQDYPRFLAALYHYKVQTISSHKYL